MKPRPPYSDPGIRAKLIAGLSIGGIDECWVWQGYKPNDGYGRLPLTDRFIYAHRVAYELWRGPIPQGLQIDHLCRNRACANPRHLEVVTAKENTRRGNGPAGKNSRKTHCLRGHEFTPENTYIWAKDGSRRCHICQRQNEQRYRERNKKEAMA